jgi:hypothetical protein
MSQQVLWEVVKNHNAFLVKSNGITLSRDPFNPTGKMTYGATGIVSKTIIIRFHPEGWYRHQCIKVSLPKQLRGERAQEGQVSEEVKSTC